MSFTPSKKNFHKKNNYKLRSIFKECFSTVRAYLIIFVFCFVARPENVIDETLKRFNFN